MLERCRQVYNSLLNERKALYEICGNAPTMRQQQRSLTHWKKASPELKAVHSQVLQNVSVRVEFAFQAFFRRIRNGEKAGQAFAKDKVGIQDSRAREPTIASLFRKFLRGVN